MGTLRVVDLTAHLSGPFCTWTLASLGMEVIKVEPPAGGELARETPPFVNGHSLYFDSLNRGKKSLVLDLKTLGGREALHRLVARSDVFVENFRPGVRDRLGCSDETLNSVNPNLVIASISGFGQTGPLADRPAFDIIVQAMSGMMSINGQEGAPGVRVGFSIGDIAAGLFAAIGILSRLYERDTSQRHFPGALDISMLASQIACLENAYARWLNAGDVPEPIGSRHPSMTPFEAFEAGDGPLVIGIGGDRDWPVLCTILGATDLRDDPRFKTTAGRLDHRDLLETMINEILRTQPVAIWLERLHNAGIACGPVNSVPDFASSDLIREIGGLSDVSTPGEKTMTYAAHPLRDNAAVPERAAPKLGEHSSEILRDLGYGPSEITALTERS